MRPLHTHEAKNKKRNPQPRQKVVYPPTPAKIPHTLHAAVLRTSAQLVASLALDVARARGRVDGGPTAPALVSVLKAEVGVVLAQVVAHLRATVEKVKPTQSR